MEHLLTAQPAPRVPANVAGTEGTANTPSLAHCIPDAVQDVTVRQTANHQVCGPHKAVSYQLPGLPRHWWFSVRLL